MCCTLSHSLCTKDCTADMLLMLGYTSRLEIYIFSERAAATHVFYEQSNLFTFIRSEWQRHHGGLASGELQRRNLLCSTLNDSLSPYLLHKSFPIHYLLSCLHSATALCKSM
jgi:hypothetical protein